jgi:hypothetical protein
MIEEKKAYPLKWPLGYKRTLPADRVSSNFKQTMDKAQRLLREEVRRMNGEDLIVSTDLRYREDGMLYASEMKRKSIEPGVAIYFKYKGKDVAMCCDKYVTIWENIYALAKGIDALRGMERWGVSEFMDRAFAGFTAIPEKSEGNFWGILGIDPTNDEDVIRKAYLTEAKKHHPDRGGDDMVFSAVQDAYRLALEYCEKDLH